MISVFEAKRIVQDTEYRTSPITIYILESNGYYLAEDLHAPIDLPPFDQSSIDGYAIKGNPGLNFYKQVGSIRPGESPQPLISPGTCQRIYTGACIPAGTDFLVMQEFSEAMEIDLIKFSGKDIFNTVHIRKKGRQIKAGELAVKKGTRISPSIAGFIGAMGIGKLIVHQKPKIGLIITGNEFSLPGTILESGRVYESNSISIKLALENAGIKNVQTEHIPEDLFSLEESFERLSKQNDLVLISGGVSVGDFDYSRTFLTKNINQKFYKVAQKPGKPLFFGLYDRKPVFGLPGNPASTLICFYEYVLPCLLKIQGAENCEPAKLQLTLRNEIIKPEGIGVFLKAEFEGNQVWPLEGQESYILRSFGESPGIIFIPQGISKVEKGELVEVHLYE